MARRAKRTTTRTKSKGTSRPRAAASTANPIGQRTVTPYLVIDGASKAIEFYKRAFGAKEVNRSPMPDGSIMHASIRFGDSFIMMSDEFPGGDSKSPTSVGSAIVYLHIYSEDDDYISTESWCWCANRTFP